MTPLKLLLLDNTSIHSQLLLEEALLRTSDDNWCIVNTGSSPSIVVGISGKIPKLINADYLAAHPIPVIRRFSGGGTVVVDNNTLFTTFIMRHDAVEVEAFPPKIMRWTEEFYSPVFKDSSFALRENDYVFGDRKFGGNAQYITKQRWLHHSSFLWDFLPERMSYLKLPEKRPGYRGERSHFDFLCRLKEKMTSQNEFISLIKNQLSRYFEVKLATLADAEKHLSVAHRRSTQLIESSTLVGV